MIRTMKEIGVGPEGVSTLSSVFKLPQYNQIDSSSVPSLNLPDYELGSNRDFTPLDPDTDKGSDTDGGSNDSVKIVRYPDLDTDIPPSYTDPDPESPLPDRPSDGSVSVPPDRD